MAEHTPGPWDLVVHGKNDSRVGRKTLLAIVYSENFGDRPTQEANARLIAAAPDLLLGCKAALRYRDGLVGTAIVQIEAAIAKAEGRDA